MHTRPFASSEPANVVMNGWTGTVMASVYPLPTPLLRRIPDGG